MSDYTPSGNPLDGTKYVSRLMRSEFSLIQTAVNSKVDETSGTASNLTLTGTPVAPTATPGTSTTQVATTAFCAALAFSSALPAQTGNSYKWIYTNGSSASWEYLPLDQFLQAQGVI